MRTRFLLASMSCAPMIWCALVGCTSIYAVSFRDHQTLEPIADTAVTVSSAARIYSFLDLRHYLAECGKRYVVEGKTNSQGEMTATMPADLPVARVALGEPWIAVAPSAEWTAMLTQKEFETGVSADQLRDVPGRPEVRVHKK